jgi:hypothetical protein
MKPPKLELSLLSLREDRCAAFPPPLWGRIKEGGRAGLRDKSSAASITSSVGATPTPARPHKGGGCANVSPSTQLQQA